MKRVEDLFWTLDRIANRFLPYNLMVKYRVHCSLLFATLAIGMVPQPFDLEAAAPVAAFSMWHFALYMYNRYTDRGEDTINSPVEAMDDFHGRIAVFLSYAMLVAGFGLLLFYDYTTFYYVIALPIAFIYGMPLFGGRLRIKSITLFKNIFSAVFIWALPIALISMTYRQQQMNFHPFDLGQYSWENFSGLFVGMFFVVVVYELLWDLRDVEGDRKSGVMTVPVRFGEVATKLLVALILISGYLLPALPLKTFIFLSFFSIILYERCAPVLTHIMIITHIILFNLSAFAIFF